MRYGRTWGRLGMIYKTYTMENALEAIIDYRGKTPKKADTGIPALSAKSVKNNYIDYNACYYISPEEYKRFMVRGKPQKGDILLTTEAPMGMVACLDRDDVAIAQRLLTLRGKENILDNNYLLYYLQSPIGQALLRARETGTTVTGIKQSEFKKIQISIPDIEVQRKIETILRTIDKKIVVNESINRNLSEQLKAIFSKMFPTITDNGSNTLEEIISFSNGKKRPDTEGKVSVYGGNGILSYTDKSNAENCVIIGRVGAYCGSLYLSVEPCWISDNAIKAKAKNSNSQMFIYYLLQELALSNRHIGTSQPLLTQGILNAIPFNCPSEEDVISFCKKADDIQKLIDMNTIENKRLSELRDTLLPKLMSGELDVSDLNI